ncbi:uncharacterized protein LOC131849649 [Achroia grisella]|uniref:uncharacterized protein LOC131849649 n=1 Tax=Achroia grisella TaxID=688607 RepID=UPI0027D32BC1|nr:uncharacterized protein LOC131849649 [Achroia grisella]
MEMEKDRSLAFLDILVMMRTDGSVTHTVYRKPTHTDRYLHASSHHHPRHLQSVVTSHTNRAQDLCAPKFVEQELSHIQEVLKRNGYIMSRRQTKRVTKAKKPEVNRQPAYMPYLRGITDKIGTALNKYSIKTVYYPPSKVTNNLRSPKDKLPYEAPGVYKIDCSCGSFYIGQTKRSIAERLKKVRSVFGWVLSLNHKEIPVSNSNLGE